jgi:hypothetical protein
LATAPTAFSQALVVTLEAPKVQRSSLFTNPTGFGATNVIVETFDELKAGFISKPVPFAGNNALGSYDHLLVRSADAFGGAGGKGTYMTANTNINKGSSPTTLTLATPQRYFGLWWSAGDPNNGVPLSLEPKRTLRAGCPNEFFCGIGIAKRPEVASQDRIGHCEMVASKHVEMLIC